MSRMPRLSFACAAALWACGDTASPAGADAPDDAAAPDGGEPAPLGPALYPADRTLSPLTPALVERLRAVHAAGAGDPAVFAKIGDSHTVSTSYLHCFGGSAFDLDGRELEATRAHFLAGDAAGTTPYQRTSLAATVGWSATSALAGAPSPIERELAAIEPAFATVMFGTNDVGGNQIARYGQNLAAIADQLLARGVIPMFSTIPPRDDSATANAMVPQYNAIARGIAQTRGVPLLDLHRELVPLVEHGLGGDNLHLNAFGSGACRLTAAGLAYGHNVRNLITLQTLDRLRRTVLAGEPAPDDPATVPHLAGAGSADDPFVITARPFADRRDTRTFGTAAIASYPACSPADERGPEVYYRLDVAAPTRLRAYIIDSDADVDLQLLRATPTADACIARGDTSIDANVEAGTYYLVADTYQDLAGDFTLVVGP